MRIAAWTVALGLAASAFAADPTCTGYLSDTYCGMAGRGQMDGADLVNAPADHTTACQIACAKGGYGVMLKEGTSYSFIPFDAKGSELAQALLKSTKRTKGLLVEVTGVRSADRIAVSAIKEAGM